MTTSLRPHWKSWLIKEIIPKWALIQVSEILYPYGSSRTFLGSVTGV